MTSRIAALILLMFTASCAGDRLGDAFFENTVDTLTLASLTGTPVSEASGYSIAEDRLVRTDLTTNFDLVYLFKDGRHLLLPLDAVGLGGRTSDPGLQPSAAEFDAIINPPSTGYITADSVAVAVGDVLVGRSRITCILSVPQYAKFEILAFDDLAATVTFRVVANTNCGFRELGPGLPEN